MANNRCQQRMLALGHRVCSTRKPVSQILCSSTLKITTNTTPYGTGVEETFTINLSKPQAINSVSSLSEFALSKDININPQNHRHFNFETRQFRFPHTPDCMDLINRGTAIEIASNLSARTACTAFPYLQKP